jgi:hypothetical protein
MPFRAGSYNSCNVDATYKHRRQIVAWKGFSLTLSPGAFFDHFIPIGEHF